MEHQPVLLDEVITGLEIIPDGIYIDGTFGRGGHAEAILKRLNANGHLIAIDKDLDAISYAENYFAHDKRFAIVQGSFANIGEVATQCGVLGRVNGVLLDLGVSSPQLDNPDRGFSFINEGPLDMRMDKTQALTAEILVNHAKESELADVFYELGEERFARRVAHAIVLARMDSPISTTRQLAEIVKAAIPKWEKHKHPATRVFQAIRIHVNHELEDLSKGLSQSLEVLAPHGRLAVISFHSLEDRMVKQFMLSAEQGPKLPKEVAVLSKNVKSKFRRVGKAIKPQAAEIELNVRARSAVLRLGEKLS